MDDALSQQLADVWARLDLVMDPELDEPVTDMGFIEAVSITGPASMQDNSTVDVSFRLPTYWCSPNFAFLMAEDIAKERGVQLTDDIKEKILGLNAARLYNIDIAARKAEFAKHPMSIAAE